MALNIRQKQSEALAKLLHPNHAGPGASRDPGEVYKVLILDAFSKDIIAPLLRVSDLRKHGVTLHLMIESARQPIADVPAVYLVRPTPANIERIAADAAAGLYESMHINFTASVSSRLIEQLATGVVKAGALQRMGKVFDQYVSFIALESTLFSLGLPDAYVNLNDPAARDAQIEESVASIVEGLLSVCVSLGVVPLIRCPRGGAAEAVAAALDVRLRDALKGRHNLFSEGVLGLSAPLTRPLLVLFDRMFDLSAALQHGWTYKPLVQDVLGLRLNRVALQDAAGPGPGSVAATALGAKRAFDVDERDFFWEACGSMPFPKMAEEVEAALSRYRAAVEDINRKTNGAPQEGAYDPDEAARRNTQHLMSAVSSLPELQEQKKVLDKHTSLATQLLCAIKARALDQYHALGEDLLSGKNDLPAVLKLLGGSKGTAQDKLRLALLYVLAQDGLPSDSDMQDLESLLRNAGSDTGALTYIRTLKRNNLLSGGAASKPASINDALSAASNSNLLDLADKMWGQGISSVTKGVKSLLSGARQAPVTAAVESLMDAKPGSAEFESYAIFDPKTPAGRPAGLDRARGPFREAIVFMIGGGNYLERETLVSWAARCVPQRTVVYGATEVLSGAEFAAQLSDLGRRSAGT